MSTNIDLTPSQAVRVSYGAPNNNYDSVDNLRVGVQSSTSTRYMSLVQFDLSSIPSNSIIDSATFRMWSIDDLCWNATTTQLAKRVTSSWSQGTATYNSRPTTTDTNQASMTDGGYDEWYEWNVKDICQLWSNGTSNYGFWIIQDGLLIEKGKCFERTGSSAPQLEIDYTPVGMQAKVSGSWESCLAHAKVSGSWELCKSHINDSGTWKQAK